MPYPKPILDDTDVCPKCGAIIKRDVSIGDGYHYDGCIWCGFTRKMRSDGTIVKKESE